MTTAIASVVIRIGQMLNSSPEILPAKIDSQFFRVKPPMLSLPSSGIRPSVRKEKVAMITQA